MPVLESSGPPAPPASAVQASEALRLHAARLHDWLARSLLPAPETPDTPARLEAALGALPVLSQLRHLGIGVALPAVYGATGPLPDHGPDANEAREEWRLSLGSDPDNGAAAVLALLRGCLPQSRVQLDLGTGASGHPTGLRIAFGAWASRDPPGPHLQALLVGDQLETEWEGDDAEDGPDGRPWQAVAPAPAAWYSVLASAP